MLFLISPAKSLDYDSPLPDLPHSEPQFTKQSVQLIRLLRRQSPQQLSELMGISDKLASLNVARYLAWRSTFTADNSRQAALAFDGDVYGGLDARSLAPDDLAWAQQHLCILSGLYGVLRPLDWMQPYRLEMGTQLPNAVGKDLYAFWATTIARYLKQRLKDDPAPVIVNLASQEYFKAVDRKLLKRPVVDCVFQEQREEGYKIISFMAKRARGLMARYAITQRVTQVARLRDFDLEGYAYAAEASTPDRLVFRRSAAA